MKEGSGRIWNWDIGICDVMECVYLIVARHVGRHGVLERAHSSHGEEGMASLNPKGYDLEKDIWKERERERERRAWPADHGMRKVPDPIHGQK